ncbi:PREDICTED: granzyme A-like [Elephantulus edwardii]|uniref:granzyme A-like n=1 Tax=Elephantulus edwardii TaxID=28737 RepID=UPI0003F0BDB5|nr:PREDICTED: granzyme A-like [Elephantulus edwardii]
MKTSCTCLPSFLPVVTFLLLISEDFCVEIIGGKEVVAHSKPYMALILGQETCSGTLIGNKWVLTAAHCSVGVKSQVILGAHSISNEMETERQIMYIKKEIPYPCYDPETREGDLKLLKLRKKATINKNVKILEQPKSGEDVKPGTKCKVAAWGKSLKIKHGQAGTLREINVTVIDRKTCNDDKHYAYNPIISINMICAGNPKGGKESCDGNSGGPLICGGVLRGITSFGRPGKCGSVKVPGIYIRLSKKYLTWIASTVKKTI